MISPVRLVNLMDDANRVFLNSNFPSLRVHPDLPRGPSLSGRAQVGIRGGNYRQGFPATYGGVDTTNAGSGLAIMGVRDLSDVKRTVLPFGVARVLTAQGGEANAANTAVTLAPFVEVAGVAPVPAEPIYFGTGRHIA